MAGCCIHSESLLASMAPATRRQFQLCVGRQNGQSMAIYCTSCPVSHLIYIVCLLLFKVIPIVSVLTSGVRPTAVAKDTLSSSNSKCTFSSPRSFCYLVLVTNVDFLAGSSHSVGRRSTENVKLVCYYSNWAVYRPGMAKFTPQNINPFLCVWPFFPFAHCQLVNV